MTVQQDFELRKSVRGRGRELQGHQESHRREGRPRDSRGRRLLKELKGMSSLAYTSGDPVALAKALTAYAKANPSFTFPRGHGGGPRGRRGGHQELATLPAKEEIYAKLLWLINAPAQRLVTAIGGVGRNLAWWSTRASRKTSFRNFGPASAGRRWVLAASADR
jgi:large subunit ribosomal protein L10